MRKHHLTVILLFFVQMLFATKTGVNKQNQHLFRLLGAYKTISENYVEDIDTAKVVDEAIISMLETLDPHSSYIPAKDVQRANEPLEGNFDGVGIQFNILDDTLYVVSVIPGGPSEKVGLRAGDRIIKVDSTNIAGIELSNNQVLKMLRGKKGSKVDLLIKRKSETISYRVVRDKIPLFSINASYMLTSNIGYIKIDRFASSTYNEFMEALKKLNKAGMKNLVIDLQGNGGGYMGPAIKIAEQLLKKGQLVVYTEGKNSPKQLIHCQQNANFKGKLTLLIDEGSASASEILAGAIQDWDRGLIVGRRSFGKGLVQRKYNLPDGAEMRLTTARYYTPSGRSIQKPYVKGEIDEYHNELLNRYKHGEFVNVDSINLPDSLKFQTLLNKRTVYGGGGIMPDYFIPMDTTTYSKFHLKVVRQNTLNNFILNYMDENREKLDRKYKDFESFNSNFEITEDIFQELVAEAAKDSIEYDAEEFKVSRDYLFLQMKALIAKDLFDMSEYYEIMNTRDELVLKAVELLNNKNYENISSKY